MCQNPNGPDTDDRAKIASVVERFVAALHSELSERWRTWRYEFSLKDLHAVVGGLLSRQVTLAAELARAPSCWNYHVGPLFLRAMAEVHITVAWILHDPNQQIDRCKKYIDFGLGQQKLELERRRTTIKERDRDPTDEEVAWMEVQEQWINSQRATFLTEVNVGSWSGIPVRKMAEDAGCIDFYNHVYTPWSAVAHSTWQHIGRYNVTQCQNPLHGFHLVPAAIDAAALDVLYLAGKYADKTFRLFDTNMGVKTNIACAFDDLVSGLTELSEALNQSDDTPAADNRQRQE
ncbi:MAG: DUF5677 domain-containing protein [Spirochaetaceae bacterium]|nr:DUF5677 domain-containing protein [Spirochaetaceae bacterium]